MQSKLIVLPSLAQLAENFAGQDYKFTLLILLIRGPTVLGLLFGQVLKFLKTEKIATKYFVLGGESSEVNVQLDLTEIISATACNGFCQRV